MVGASATIDDPDKEPLALGHADRGQLIRHHDLDPLARAFDRDVEPNNQPLWEVTRRRILAALTAALRGEIQPSGLDVSVEGTGERIQVVVSYQLASIGVTQRQRFFVGVIDRG